MTSAYRNFGKLEFPLPPNTETDFSWIDPAQDILLELFAAAINAELANHWAQVTDNIPRLVGSSPVKSKLPEFPDADTMGQIKETFPLLCVYRSDDPETFEDFTIEERRVTSKWGVDYIIGPLEAGNRMAMGDLLRLIPRLIDNVIQEGGHSSYATQTNGDYTFAKRVLGKGDGCCGFSTIRVVESRSGAAALSQGGPKYLAASLVLETTELDGIDPDLGVPYTGSTFTGSTGYNGTTPLVVADSAIPLIKT